MSVYCYPPPINSWPREEFIPVATVAPEPEEIEARIAITFTEGHDHLDYFKAAAVRTERGVVFQLIKYRNGEPGTQVYFPCKSLRTELNQPQFAKGSYSAFLHVLDVLRIPVSELIWKSDLLVDDTSVR